MEDILTSDINTDLSAPVDVYYDWVDACDKIAKEGAEATTGVSPPRLSNNRVGATSSRAAAGASASGEMDDFLEDDEMDAEADFAA
jgi:transcription elongation factor Elf1